MVVVRFFNPRNQEVKAVRSISVRSAWYTERFQGQASNAENPCTNRQIKKLFEDIIEQKSPPEFFPPKENPH